MSQGLLARARGFGHRVPGLPAAAMWVTSRVGNRDYRAWIDRVEARSPVDLATLGYRPLVSVVVPAFNTPEPYLDALWASLRAQRYEQWELCLVDGSSDTAARARLQNLGAGDPRVRYVSLPQNLGIAGNTNASLAVATGEYVAFLDHDDTLGPDALAGAVALLQGDPGERPEVIYSDEDKLTAGGEQRLLPFFKPAFDIELFLTVNYICHFAVVKRSLVERIGGIRTGFDGAQDYDFLLRACEASTVPPARVPAISYHWRMGAGSTARHAAEKSPAIDAGRRALQEHHDRLGIAAEVVALAPDVAAYRTHYRSSTPVRVDLRATTRAATDTSGLTLVGPGSSSDVTVILANGAVPESDGWLRELVLKALQPGVAAVGAPAVTPDGTLCLGYDRTAEGVVAHCYSSRARRRPGYEGEPLWPRTVAAVAPAALAVRTERLADLADPADPAASGPSLPALSLALAGRDPAGRVVCWPYAGSIAIPSLPETLDVDPRRLPATVNPALALSPAGPVLRP